MERNTLPVYEVEFLPVERRLTDRRQSLFDARVFNLQASSSERRHQDRRQPLQAARTA